MWKDRRVVNMVTVGLVAVLLTGCGGSAATDYQKEYGGSAAVYSRIAGETDCLELQAEFEQASDNNDLTEPGTPQFRQTLGYMTAAEDRRQALSC